MTPSGSRLPMMAPVDLRFFTGTEKATKAGLLAVDLGIASRRKQPDTDG
ncbi:hypothetical protein [Streptomyces sp. NBC_00690]|nr:hypothetical protein [Streptomyces sp. NBC_00690]